MSADREQIARDVQAAQTACEQISHPLWPGLTESDWLQLCQPLVGHCEALLAENERLREALRYYTRFENEGQTAHAALGSPQETT